jgi:fluoroquinolone resistance protein
MRQDYYEQQLFTKQDYSEFPLPKGEYDTCNFRDCNFSGSDLTGIRFVDCTFHGCDLSNLKVSGSSIHETVFKDCKMLGFRFDECDQLGLTVRFENSQLDHSSFYQVKLNHTVFLHTSLQGVDFTEADLRNVILDHCDLLDATFEHANLERANLTTALNYSIDPENNRISGARFSLPAVTGLLNKYNIEIQ